MKNGNGNGKDHPVQELTASRESRQNLDKQMTDAFNTALAAMEERLSGKPQKKKFRLATSQNKT